MTAVTQLLRNWSEGDPDALNELLPLVYDELYRLAVRYMRLERAGHTFRPTDLVSEAYLRLVAGGPAGSSDRTHFFGIAARVMRQILVDSARKRCAGKRGSGEQPIAFDDVQVATERPEELVALDDALLELARLDERKAQTVELFYFGGLTQDEIAGMQQVHVNTVARDLRFAEAWVNRFIREAL